MFAKKPTSCSLLALQVIWVLRSINNVKAFAVFPLVDSHNPKYTSCSPVTSSGSVLSLRSNTPYDDNDYNGDNDEEEDDEPPNVDIANFSPPSTSFGLNKGRSSPSQRKAMGRSSASVASVHICTNCGSEYVKWMGRCPTCKEWNTLQEHAVIREKQSSTLGARPQPTFGGGSRRPNSWLDGVMEGVSIGNTPVRISDLVKKDTASTGLQRRRRLLIPGDEELNTVLGGGIMQGSLTLLGGDPGVGKSTLLLQTAGSVASLSTPTPGIGMGSVPIDTTTESPLGPVWYVSGEENPDQIASRAERLGIAESELFILSETHVDSLCAQVVSKYNRQHPSVFAAEGEDDELFDTPHSAQQAPQPLPPALLVIDSIQTMICDSAGASAAGGVTQVRECVALFLRLAKSTGIPILLVGHVTKSGDVAGPRTVEHMVDCVLYLEGLGDMNLRMLRASKNRFGSSDEVGVYEMTAGRLLPVSDPSSLFLAHRSTEMEDTEGSAIALALEGMRALTVEIQSLVTPVHFDGGFGRRTVDGIAFSRLQLLMGVLQKRCGIYMGKQDVFVNVVGRIRLDRAEANAADLAVAVALVSSLTCIPVRSDTAFVGEIGLLGELRTVPAMEKRLQEARRMGFSRVVSACQTPLRKASRGRTNLRQQSSPSPVRGIEWIQCKTALEAINAGLIKPLPKRRARKKNSRKTDNSQSTTPSQLEDLGLEIMDDGDDEDDDMEGDTSFL